MTVLRKLAGTTQGKNQDNNVIISNMTRMKELENNSSLADEDFEPRGSSCFKV